MGKGKKIGIILHKTDSYKIGKADVFLVEKMEKLVKCKIENSPDKEKMIKNICDRLEHIYIQKKC